MAQEIELKLRIDAAGLAHLARNPVLTRLMQVPPKTRQQDTTYYDTPDFALLRGGAAVRIRQSGPSYRQTIKAGGCCHGGIWSRDEWEQPVDGLCPDLSAVCHTEHPPLLCDPALAGQLRPVFRTEIRRTACQLNWQGAAIELVLDQGQVVALPSSAGADGRGQAAARVEPPAAYPLSEVELELKSGSPSALYDLAALLLDGRPGWVGIESKSECGYRLIGARPLIPLGPGNQAEGDPVRSGAQDYLHLTRNALGQYLLYQDIWLLMEAEQSVAAPQLLAALRQLLGLLSPVAGGALAGPVAWLGGVLVALSGAAAGSPGAGQAVRQVLTDPASLNAVLTLGGWLTARLDEQAQSRQDLPLRTASCG